MYPDELRYSATHQWVRVVGETAVVGITEYAEQALGEVIFLDLPEVGRVVAAGDEIGSVESVKSISSIYSPLSGTVTETNQPLVTQPAKINEDPYGEGWLVKLAMQNPVEVDALLTAAQYQEFIMPG